MRKTTILPIITLLRTNDEPIGEHEVTEEELQFIEDFAAKRDITFEEAYNHMVRVGMEIELRSRGEQ